MSNTASKIRPVQFRFFRESGEFVESSADTVEGAILSFRKERRRRKLADRAIKTTFEYRFDKSEWMK